MIKRFFAITLIVYILLHASLSGLYAERRTPTEEEYRKFMPKVQLWLGLNWEKKKIVDKTEGVFIKQQITDAKYCCIDEDGEHHLHIVDIKFHAVFYNRNTPTEEKDMNQRLLFKCSQDGRIEDWDAMPAYNIEEVG